jgi:hypothetical protein
VTITRSDGNDFKSNTKIELQDDMGNVLQELEIHTSCSATLAVHDEFGGLTLTNFNGADGGIGVKYGYTVTNNGDALTGINLVDDILGDIAGPFDLGGGESAQFTTMASILGTTTNVGTVTGFLANGDACIAADSTTVTVVEPPELPGSCADGKPKTLVFEYTGDDCSASNNPQDGKAKCDGALSGHQPVSVEYTGKDTDKISVDPGDESINIGDLLIIDAHGRDRLHANTKLEISQGGALLQKLEIHTSCSQPIAEGDQFGSLILRQFVPEN